MKTETFEIHQKMIPFLEIDGQRIEIDGLAEIIGNSFVKRERIEKEKTWERQENGKWRTTFKFEGGR